MSALTSLSLAMSLFVLSHLLLPLPQLRDALVARFGELPFRAFYSAVALALLLWTILAYRQAPIIQLWMPPTALRHLSLSLMPFVCILLVAGVSTPNPSAMGPAPARVAARGPVGIAKVTRHPVMWAIGIWGILHLLANGDAAGIILFGGMTVLALGGALVQDARKRRLLGKSWVTYAGQTSHLPLLAMAQGRTRVTLREIGYGRIIGGVILYAILLGAHAWLFGVNPFAAG
ncbi:NnrU family protein [Defluviicoccus vanus]|uniref:NnrU family protein n=1 Tax=Defluviicoccus vanus TaxID=111831 RepID=A0A7H1N000_9PROT|nr:NnrU family protein [Defluviicoccus vanus]QNT69036.1 NnrU family protein [Defluviicoccus vanus]